jgi:ParB-like chromosome segregation protein Spo0J
MTERSAIRKIADETGVDQATVRRALKAAGLDVRNPDISHAVQIVRAVADADRILGHAASGRGEGGDTGANPYAAAKAQAEIARARKLEIQNAKAEAKLVSRDAVTETGAHIIATVRTAFMSLGFRLAEKVAGKTNLTEIAGIIESEVRIVLGDLADEQTFLNRLSDEALA